ncbi:L domain-like protein [Leucogyrophana mollusca]|uniref:L domain-like protein n=1 Tax=Leucogyrophana mollusca TaxID=85980 RepID=A0ACB8B5F0_9AGAM|nr:L domain-like protein [Leucogyrophana mollusca]
MSRIPQPPSSRPGVRTSALTPPTSRSRAPSPSKPASSVPPPTPSRVRTKSVPKSPTKPPARRPVPADNDPPVPKTPLSIKEAIALKRAEAKKATSKGTFDGGSGSSFDTFENLEDALPTSLKKDPDDGLELGRWSVKETIERARSTGSINLSTRSLPCLPSALFELHLGVTVDPLKSVPNESPISSSDASAAPRRGGQREGPAWFETQDLQVLKAWNNEIIEIQHEISLFGSLKTIDLHQNKIVTLPDTFADLMALTTLDLSNNALTSLPTNLFALPSLTSLNLSHNALATLPFGAPFSRGLARESRSNASGGSFFGPVITRASSPLPRLLTLNVSYNKLLASGIDHTIDSFPKSIVKADFSGNPLSVGNSECSHLIQALGQLKELKELRFETADIGDDAFTLESTLFSSLCILDLGETRATVKGMQAALSNLKQTILFDLTTEEPADGVLRISVGKKVIKEAWELEAERRARSRGGRSGRSLGNSEEANTASASPKVEAVKEAWEIEAEQGLLTEGGRRRARAAAAANDAKPPPLVGKGTPPTPPPISQTSSTASLTKYHHAATQTLTLPPSAPPAKSHARSFSLAASSLTNSATSPQGKTDIALPTPSLPLAVISSQVFSQTLKILILSNRKLDLSISLPPSTDSSSGGLLFNLEELVLDGCGFGDNVSVTREAASGATTPPRTNEALLPLLTRLFPGLRTLDLSYNSLSSAALKGEILSSLILANSQDDPSQYPRKGLRHLRLRGNRITELDGFQVVAEMFKGHRAVPDWKLEELDLRDNEISKLPAELGLLPLDVFLVDGNTFRIPQRRVWEREGTKGLLSWLRGRLE